MTKLQLNKDELIQLIETPKENAATALDRLGGVRGVAEKLDVQLESGLISTAKDDLEQREQIYGRNYVQPPCPKTFFELMWDAFQDVTIIILSIAGVISLILGLTVDHDPSTGWIEGATILVAVTLVTVVTAANDYKKEQQFRALNAVKEDEKIKVIRDGVPAEVSKFSLVVGDIVRVELGDILPADGLVFDEKDLKIDESAMTGESDLLAKHSTEKPFLLSGTKAMEGLGKMLVVCVGESSQAGIISKLIATGNQKKPTTTSLDNVQTEATGEDQVYVNVDTPTAGSAPKNVQDEEDEDEIAVSPLQGKLNILTIWLGKGGTAVALIVFLAMSVRFSIETFAIDNKPWSGEFASKYLDFFIVAITVLVVAIPEGLPLAVTISLAYSVKKMLKDNNLVRHLDACETMGSATTICSDKTGTLTTNRMTVMEYWIDGMRYDHDPNNVTKTLSLETKTILTNAICINSTAEILPPQVAGGLPEHTGNKTECAMLQLCRDFGVDYSLVRAQADVTRMITFSSTKKRMSVVTRNPDLKTYRSYTKGATEVVLELCDTILAPDGTIRPLNGKDRVEIGENVIEKFASKGLRTLCLAYRDLNEESDNETDIESKLTCVAIVGIEDPVRPEVPNSIAQCRRAGIVVRMVTGDNITTARSIAKKCGLYKENDGSLIMEGREFRQRVLNSDGSINQIEFDKIWPSLRVLARSSPKDKHTLVSGIIQSNLPQHGPQVVAVTGDGTNDAPALKRADVGFAMGISGTAVAKDASDIILMDDNFTSIVNAVKWGRNVYDSISKFLQFQLTVNVVAISIAVIGAIALEESPLTAVQLLWVNLIMDTFASLALATEPPTPSLLERKPYPRTKPLLSRKMIKHILGQSVLQLLVLLILVFAGDDIFNIPSGRALDRKDSDAPRDTSQHYTIVFNVFVFLQLFNELNARKIHDEINCFEGVFTNPVYLSVCAFQITAQIFIVEFGGLAFGTKGLSISQWFICIALGALSLPVGLALRLIKTNETEHVKTQDEPKPMGSRGQELWIRGLTRVRAQIRVVNAFKRGLVRDGRVKRFLSVDHH